MNFLGVLPVNISIYRQIGENGYRIVYLDIWEFIAFVYLKQNSFYFFEVSNLLETNLPWMGQTRKINLFFFKKKIISSNSVCFETKFLYMNAPRQQHPRKLYNIVKITWRNPSAIMLLRFLSLLKTSFDKKKKQKEKIEDKNSKTNTCLGSKRFVCSSLFNIFCFEFLSSDFCCLLETK